MANFVLLLIVAVVFQTSSYAAPSGESHSITRISTRDHKTGTNTHRQAVHRNIDNEASESHRQTRLSDGMQFGYPPFSYPFPYFPSFSIRGESQETGGYGPEDAISLIFKQLQQIERGVRQNIPRIHKTPAPAYIPVVYIPPVNCGCKPNGGASRPTDDRRNPSVIPASHSGDLPNNNPSLDGEKNVTIEDRFPVLDDTRQNWGLTVNNTNVDDEIEGDGSRPINLQPIPPEEPLDVPVPPVDHGTVQAGAEPQGIPNQIDSSTANRRPAQVPPPAPPAASYIPQSNDDSNLIPTACDRAIRHCCNQRRITLECFTIQGCRTPTIYGKRPCDPEIQLLVVNKLKYAQERKTG